MTKEKYLKEEEGDKCPLVGDIISKEKCNCCPHRGTIWIKKNRKITIRCKYDEEDE